MAKKKRTGYRYLAKNIGLLSVSQFGTKVLSFLLVPLYTTVLSAAEYGIYDLFNTTVLLVIPIITLNIMESVMRFSLDRNESPKEIFSIALNIYFKGLLLLLVLVGINCCINFFPALNKYFGLFILMYMATSIYQIMSNFARGLDDVLGVSIAGIIVSVVTIGLNIILLLVFKWGLFGYFVSTIFANTIAIIFFVIKLKLWRYIAFPVKNIALKRKMLAYSVPMILTVVSWWINSASDRYIVIWLCGIAANGVYSVGYKIPSILNVFQTIFNQAWVLSSVRGYDQKDTDGFFTKTYNLYNFAMVIVCSLIIIFTKMLAKLLYAKAFYEAWAYVPFLTIAIVFGAMSGYIGGIFSAAKDTKAFGLTTAVGAVVNIILNIILIYYIGPIGAAIATLISYFVVWQVRVCIVKKYMKLKLSLKRDYLIYAILIVQSILIITINETPLLYLALSILLMIIIIVCRKERKMVTDIFKQLIHR